MLANKFTKFQRIKNEKEIFSLLKTGKRRAYGLFTIIYRKSSSTFDRVAIIVSKKNGSAVFRNKVKRIFREVFRSTRVESPPFFDILICPHCSSSVSVEKTREKYTQWRKRQKTE